MNNIELICSLVGSAFAGGWLTKILTVRQEKKKVTAEADKMASDNWRELAEKFEERMNVLEEGARLHRSNHDDLYLPAAHPQSQL